MSACAPAGQIRFVSTVEGGKFGAFFFALWLCALCVKLPVSKSDSNFPTPTYRLRKHRPRLLLPKLTQHSRVWNRVDEQHLTAVGSDHDVSRSETLPRRPGLETEVASAIGIHRVAAVVLPRLNHVAAGGADGVSPGMRSITVEGDDADGGERTSCGIDRRAAIWPAGKSSAAERVSVRAVQRRVTASRLR